MNKNDLKFGNIVRLRSGELYLLEPENNYASIKIVDNKTRLRNLKDATWLNTLISYNDNLKYNGERSENEPWDIVAVYKDYTLKEVLWERKEFKPMLVDENGKNYGYIGKETKLTAIFGEKLYVGDVVEVYVPENEKWSYGKFKEFVCEKTDGAFIMGCAYNTNNLKDGIDREGWQYKKVKSYKNVKHNEGYGDIKITAKLEE